MKVACRDSLSLVTFDWENFFPEIDDQLVFMIKIENIEINF